MELRVGSLPPPLAPWLWIRIHSVIPKLCFHFDGEFNLPTHKEGCEVEMSEQLIGQTLPRHKHQIQKDVGERSEGWGYPLV